MTPHRRYYIYRVVKDLIETLGRWPSGEELGQELDCTPGTANGYMRELDRRQNNLPKRQVKTNGLDYAISGGANRYVDSFMNRNLG